MSSVASYSAAEPVDYSRAAMLPDSTARPLVVGNDALSQLLVAMETLAQSSLVLGETRVKNAKSDLEYALEEFLDKLQEALAAREADDGGGLFGDIFGGLGDAFGAVLGTIADFLVDAVTMPVDVVEDVVVNFGDAAAMFNAIAASQSELFENGAVAEDVRGFNEGLARFGGDLMDFTAKYGIDLASGAATGDLSKADADAKQLWSSLKDNIIDNPHFWNVMSAAAKAASLTATVMTGGAFAVVAIGLFIALEADARFGLAEKAFGPDVAPWVSLGLGVAAAGASLGFARGAAASVKWLQAAAGIVNGASTVNAGYHAIADAQARGDDLERAASLQSSLNKMQSLQRLLDTLLEKLDSDNKDHAKTRQLGSSLVEIDTQTQAAAVIRA